MTTLQFAPWSSDLDISFYSTLASKKIDHDKLDDAARMVVGRYEVRQNDPSERSTRMQLHSGALRAEAVPHAQFRAEGMLRNVNTIEDYKKLDRASIMDQAARTIWDAIVDGSIYSCPSLLASFYAIFYADLKKYKFTYHFAFPALHSDPPWKVNGNPRKFKPDESSLLSDAVHTWRYSTDSRQHGFFLAKKRRGVFDTDDQDDFEAARPESPATPRAERLGYSWGVGSIGAYEQGFFEDVEPEDRFICFADPSTYDLNPAWPLRNFLALIKYRWKLTELQVVCYRDTHARRERPHSLILDLSLPESPATAVLSKTMPKVTGWERNDSGKLNSRLTDLSEYMDPTKLADQSVDLNLKLMKWRIAPELDLDTIRNIKCLLLGAGTLGSYVSRNLMGWGIRHITFIDNGRVSFSNPVRQPLFNFNDCTGGGVKKATRAAEALREIYPGVRSEGHAMTVPMAGHPVTDEVKSSQDFSKLKELIDGHDVIFLLMDSRESRWLPTVMGKAAGKLVVNAALGFDSYLVMRHGSELVSGEDRKQTLGCYFCNDVVAPADSQKDLTLDQQCTVTRPGIAAIASALLVELVVSVLQHPQKAAASAPANRSVERSPSNHPLGLVPHQIRGFLAQFDNLLIQGPSYDCCSACSPKILDTYRTDGWEFVKKAMNDKNYVEELSGLAEVQRKAEEMARQMEAEMEEDDADGIDDINEEGELL